MLAPLFRCVIPFFSDLAPLQDLTNLTVINLQDNDISDISALVSNGGLADGDLVYLFGNPLSSQALANVEVLRARG